MTLIKQWRKAWRMSSVQLAVLTAMLNAAAGAWTHFDGQVSPVLWASVNMGLGVAVAVARIVQQPKLEIPE